MPEFEVPQLIGYRPQLFDLTPTIQAELVRHVVAAVRPRMIVLFGSRARGDDRADSDIDLLIVQDSSLPRHLRAAPVNAALAVLRVPVDIEVLVYTPEEVEQWRHVPAALVTTALREGQVLYEQR